MYFGTYSLYIGVKKKQKFAKIQLAPFFLKDVIERVDMVRVCVYELSGCFRIKLLWVRISLLSLKLQIWRLLRERSSLTFRQTIECGLTLKLYVT